MHLKTEKRLANVHSQEKRLEPGAENESIDHIEGGARLVGWHHVARTADGDLVEALNVTDVAGDVGVVRQNAPDLLLRGAVVRQTVPVESLEHRLLRRQAADDVQITVVYHYLF